MCCNKSISKHVKSTFLFFLLLSFLPEYRLQLPCIYQKEGTVLSYLRNDIIAVYTS